MLVLQQNPKTTAIGVISSSIRNSITARANLHMLWLQHSIVVDVYIQTVIHITQCLIVLNGACDTYDRSVGAKLHTKGCATYPLLCF